MFLICCLIFVPFWLTLQEQLEDFATFAGKHYSAKNLSNMILYPSCDHIPADGKWF